METIYGDRCDQFHQACPTRCAPCVVDEHPELDGIGNIDNLDYINEQIAHQERIAPWGVTKDSYNEYSPALLRALCERRYELTR